MSKADQIRQAFADPAVQARLTAEQETQRERAQTKAVKAMRRLVEETPSAEVDVLVEEIVKLIPATDALGMAGVDRPVTQALLRELLPSYLKGVPAVPSPGPDRQAGNLLEGLPRTAKEVLTMQLAGRWTKADQARLREITSDWTPVHRQVFEDRFADKLHRAIRWS